MGFAQGPIVPENSRAYIDVSFLIGSDDEIAEWRIKTVSIARTLNMEQNQFQANNLASNLSDDLKDFMTTKRKADAQKEALYAVESVCHEAFVLAVLFRGRKTRYLWEQDANPAQITAADLEIIGWLYEEAEASQAQVTRVVFGTDVEALKLGGSNDMD